MPYGFQNGIFTCSLYHFFVNDRTGPIGIALRHYFPIGEMLGLDDKTFGIVFVGFFMQVTGILRIPGIWGPAWSPFESSRELLVKGTPIGSFLSTDLLDKPPTAPQTKERGLATPAQSTKAKKMKKQVPAAPTTELAPQPTPSMPTQSEDKDAEPTASQGTPGSKKNKKKKKKKANKNKEA
jgi:hypothetical protein